MQLKKYKNKPSDKSDVEHYFDDLVRDLVSSPIVASIVLMDKKDRTVYSKRRYRVFLKYGVEATEDLRHKLMKELQVAVSPTENNYSIEIIGIYRDKLNKMDSKRGYSMLCESPIQK